MVCKIHQRGAVGSNNYKQEIENCGMVVLFRGNLTPSHHLIVMVGKSKQQNFVLRRIRNNFILILWQIGRPTDHTYLFFFFTTAT